MFGITLASIDGEYPISIEIGDEKEERIESIETEAAVDTGVTFNLVPRHLLNQLQEIPEVCEIRSVDLATGDVVMADSKAPLRVRLRHGSDNEFKTIMFLVVDQGLHMERFPHVILTYVAFLSLA